MPYRTRYGSHYHMTEGCHGATIPCDTNGLTPCSDCCGKGGAPSSSATGTGTSGGRSKRFGPASSPSVGTGDEIMSEGTHGLSDGLSALFATIDATSMGDALGRMAGNGSGDSERSRFESVPAVGSLSEIRMLGRFEGMRNGVYLVHVKDYTGSRRTNISLEMDPPIRMRDGRCLMCISWTDGYWDKHDYFFVPADGDLEGVSIDGVSSYSDYTADLGRGVLRKMGMTDADLRRIVSDAKSRLSLRDSGSTESSDENA